MDLSKSGHRKQEDVREDPAIMLFGKQIKNLSTCKDGENIKEELSPRGVDEKGLSFATSSDEDEDLNPASEDAMHVKQSASTVMGSVLASETARDHTRKRKGVEIECVARDTDAEKAKSHATEPVTVRSGGDNHAGKLKAGIWSRCPRCNSADTKFCYFNNYNVNQPRHFCKHCQRYWTAGGTLRNVPIGAGKRKNKHALHKHNFVVANSTSALTVPTTSLSMGVPDTDPLESDTLPTSESDPLSIVKSDRVNTNLELSAHQHFTNSPMSSLSPCNIIHPHSAHKLITLHQLQENLQSRLSHPHLATGCSKLGQFYPNSACGPSPLSPIHPELAGGCSKLSQFYPESASGSPGLSQISPLLPNGLSQICPHLHSAFSGRQICPGLQSGSSEFARLGPHLQTGSSKLCYTYPHGQNGTVCKTSQECLDCKRDELSGLGKSERGYSEIEELKRNLESELPMSDQKNASLERGLPNMARTALEKDKLENKAGSLQIGQPEIMDPIEVDNYMQRLNQMKSIMGCSASNECKVQECNGPIEVKAPQMCVQGDHAQAPSTNSALGIKSEEAFNIENIMKRVGEGHNSLPIWGALWPYFYNMFWLDPLAFSQFRPILTPQGWALPFIPPSASKIEPPSGSPTTLLENFDSSSTPSTSASPTTLLAPFKDVSNGACNIASTSPGKHYAKPTPTASFRNFELVSDGGGCNIASALLRKC